MSENNCLFCDIVSGKIPSTKIFEDDRAYAFQDINPQAPTHILIVPKEHIESLNDISRSDEAILGYLLRLTSKLANQAGVADDGYRTVINTGERSGQSVLHLHIHLLAGRVLTWPPG